MEIRNEVYSLQKLGKMPNEDDDIKDGFLEEYEELLHSVSKPINGVEAKVLATLFPDISCFGLDWTLLHLIESTPNWPITEVINEVKSLEWKKIILKRIENGK